MLSDQLRDREGFNRKRHSELLFGSSASVELEVDVLPRSEALSLASNLSLVNAVFCGDINSYLKGNLLSQTCLPAVHLDLIGNCSTRPGMAD